MLAYIPAPWIRHGIRSRVTHWRPSPFEDRCRCRWRELSSPESRHVSSGRSPRWARLHQRPCRRGWNWRSRVEIQKTSYKIILLIIFFYVLFLWIFMIFRIWFEQMVKNGYDVLWFFCFCLMMCLCFFCDFVYDVFFIYVFCCCFTFIYFFYVCVFFLRSFL